MASSIVFGTTLEAECRPLAELAALVAKRMCAPLRLVHVSEDPRASSSGSGTARSHGACYELLP